MVKKIKWMFVSKREVYFRKCLICITKIIKNLQYFTA